MKKISKLICLGTLTLSLTPILSMSCTQGKKDKVDNVPPTIINKNQELKDTVNEFNNLLNQIINENNDLTSSIKNVEEFLFENDFNQQLNKNSINIFNAYTEFKNSLGELYKNEKFNELKQELYTEVLHLIQHNRENILIQIQNILTFNKNANFDTFINKINSNQEPKNEDIQNHSLKISKTYENYVFDKHYYEETQLGGEEHDENNHEHTHIDVDEQENHSHGLINLIKDIDLAIKNNLRKIHFDEFSDLLDDAQLEKLANLQNAVENFVSIYSQNTLEKLINKLIQLSTKINVLSQEISQELIK